MFPGNSPACNPVARVRIPGAGRDQTMRHMKILRILTIEVRFSGPETPAKTPPVGTGQTIFSGRRFMLPDMRVLAHWQNTSLGL